MSFVRIKHKTRSNRNTIYEHIRAELQSLGYDALRPIFLDRWMRYRLIVVAVNHLATLLKREPYRVYQALLCRAERTVKGRPFMPNRQAQLDPEGLLESERRGGLHVFCPNCGTDLIEAGKITQKEVRAEISHRKSHHIEANSSVGEYGSSVSGAESESGFGAGDTGGLDLDGGAIER